MHFETPYHHWDTDYGRRQLNSLIRASVKAANLVSPSAVTGESRLCLRPNPQTRVDNRLGISTIVEKALESSKPISNIGHLRVRLPRGPPKTRGMKLLRIFLHAAKLYEMTVYYEDQHLVKEYLFGNPPLHPRRTLYQYFNAYGFLESTEILDKGRVVCKAIAPKKQVPSHHCSRTYCCRVCMRDVRPVPKMLMIAQLWLFILNESKLDSLLRFGVTHKFS